MALRRRRDVNDVRLGRRQQFREVAGVAADAKALGELLGHQQFAIADADDARGRNALDRRHVLVGDLAAADDRDPQRAHARPRTKSK